MIQITPLIIPLFGPLAIHGYGIAIASAVISFVYLTYKDVSRFLPISFDLVSKITTHCVIAGLVGGRLLHVISDWHNYDSLFSIVSVWHGGLSILGCVLAVALYLPYALWHNKIPILVALDSAALYAPLGHAIGRLGCLWAGCCFGCESTAPWAIWYNGNTAGAPTGVFLHPAQLYSSLSFIALFIILRYGIGRNRKRGTLAYAYLMGVCAERFAVDFVRNDRILLHTGPLVWGIPTLFSLHQWIALAGVLGGFFFLYMIRRIPLSKHDTSA